MLCFSRRTLCYLPIDPRFITMSSREYLLATEDIKSYNSNNKELVAKANKAIEDFDVTLESKQRNGFLTIQSVVQEMTERILKATEGAIIAIDDNTKSQNEILKLKDLVATLTVSNDTLTQENVDYLKELNSLYRKSAASTATTPSSPTQVVNIKTVMHSVQEYDISSHDPYGTNEKILHIAKLSIFLLDVDSKLKVNNLLDDKNCHNCHVALVGLLGKNIKERFAEIIEETYKATTLKDGYTRLTNHIKHEMHSAQFFARIKDTLYEYEYDPKSPDPEYVINSIRNMQKLYSCLSTDKYNNTSEGPMVDHVIRNLHPKLKSCIGQLQDQIAVSLRSAKGNTSKELEMIDRKEPPESHIRTFKTLLSTLALSAPTEIINELHKSPGKPSLFSIIPKYSTAAEGKFSTASQKRPFGMTFLDSAASEHICAFENELQGITTVKRPIEVHGIGTATLDKIGYHPILQETMYLYPELGVNIISEAQYVTVNERSTNKMKTTFDHSQDGKATTINRTNKPSLTFTCDPVHGNLKVLGLIKTSTKYHSKTKFTPHHCSNRFSNRFSSLHTDDNMPHHNETPSEFDIEQIRDENCKYSFALTVHHNTREHQNNSLYNTNSAHAIHRRFREAKLNRREQAHFKIHLRDHACDHKIGQAMDDGVYDFKTKNGRNITFDSKTLRRTRIKLKCLACIKLQPRTHTRSRKALTLRNTPGDVAELPELPDLPPDPYPDATFGTIVHMDLFFLDSHFSTDAYLICVEHTTGEITTARLATDPYEATDKGFVTLSEAIKTLAYKDHCNQIITKVLSVDNEVTFTCKDMQKHLTIQVSNTSMGYSDGIVERAIRTIKTRSAKVIASLPYHMPKRFHQHLLTEITNNDRLYINTRIPKYYPESKTSSPYEIRCGVKPKLKGTTRFGEIVMYSLSTPGARSDLSGSRKLGIVLNGTGICTERNRYVWNITSRQIDKGSQFTPVGVGNEYEAVMNMNALAKSDQESNTLSRQSKAERGLSNMLLKRVNKIVEEQRESQILHENKPTPAPTTDDSEHATAHALMLMTNNSTLPELNTHTSQTTQAHCYLSLTQISKDASPSDLSQIRAARMKEFEQLHILQTFTVINPSCRETTIPCHMIYKKKSDGQYKARLCANGNFQDDDTFNGQDIAAHVSNTASTMMALTIAAHEQRIVEVWDVPSAYLHATLNTPVYMELRRDIATYLVQEFPKLYSGKQRSNGSIIVKLSKALYGLREAGKLWNENLASLLIEEGYTRSTLDQGIFYINNDEQKTTINTHVDDLLVTSTSQAKIDMLRKRMSSQYGEMKRQTATIDRPTMSYVGSELVIEERQIKVTQTRYTEQCLRKFDLWDKPSDIAPAPYVTGTSKAIDTMFMDKSDSPVSKSTYLSYLMTLMYLATHTRPDILLPLSVLATKIEIATESDLDQVFHVARYINGTRDKHITLKPTDLQLQVYADASHAIHDNTSSGQRKSHGGHILQLGGAHIQSKSNKMHLVTDSSTMSELVQLHQSMQELLWARELMIELGYPQSSSLLQSRNAHFEDISPGTPDRSSHPPVIWQDNKSTITIATRIPGHKGHSKHLQTKFWVIHQAWKNKEIDVRYKPTKEMLADIHTKPQESIVRFRCLRDTLLG